jgi:hypothetical protein
LRSFTAKWESHLRFKIKVRTRHSDYDVLICADLGGHSNKTTEAIDEDRFIAYNNGVVKDTKTGLEWYAGPDESTTWVGAKRLVASLNKDEFAGGGLRMPAKEELKTLYQEVVGTRNMTPLLKTTGQFVWSDKTEGSVWA